MAKVTAPLFSFTASGKIGDAMVFFGWKGLACVRQFIIPSNPQTALQGDQRIILGGTGRGVGKVDVGSEFHQQLIDLALIPSGQTKQSFLVKYIVDNYLATATAYAAELAAYTGHTAYTSFQASALDLELTAFDLPYATIAPYQRGLGLFELAKTAIALGFTGSPYNQALSTWTTTDVTMLASDMTAF